MHNPPAAPVEQEADYASLIRPATATDYRLNTYSIDAVDVFFSSGMF
jgi:hypothetical protein